MESWTAPDVPTLPGHGPALRLHDTATGEPRETVRPGGGRASMYVCGITPYDATHLGHAATMVTFDLVHRYWIDQGLDVDYVQNVTDVDEPLFERAERDDTDWQVLGLRETALYREDMACLNVVPPRHYIGAIETIPLVGKAVAALLESGAAYRHESGDVYYAVTEAPAFGSESGYDRETMLRYARERGGDPDREGKRDPLDPILWNAPREGEPSWDSPVGPGRPGWHIECTCIALEYLGATIDVQGGGSDLIYPHHEMSASHAESLTGERPFARTYVHTGMIGLDGEKMSKSLGNLVFVSKLRAEGVDPSAIRLALLAEHYRSDRQWSSAVLAEAELRLGRWREACSRELAVPAGAMLTAVRDRLADDLDTAGALDAVDAWASETLSAGGDDPSAPALARDTIEGLLGIDCSRLLRVMSSLGTLNRRAPPTPIPTEESQLKILLLVSAFNGLTQRVWCSLREQGHDVGVELAPAFDTPESLTRTVEKTDPDLILCPFLKHRVPEEVWRRWTTVIVHPGPVGDRGPSSLDHAILDRRPRWGVTALSAVEQMDAGPIWATAAFDLPPAITKSALYNSLVSDAAMTCVAETVRKVAAGEGPVPAAEAPREIPGTDELPLLRRPSFALDWRAPAAEIARRIAAADGAPGAPAELDGERYCLFDAAAVDEEHGAEAGTIVGRNFESVAIACGQGTLWVGYAARLTAKRGPKLPATMVIDASGAPFLPVPEALAESSYRREDDIGYLTIRSYNGAMHTEQCRRLTTAVEKALTEDTRMLVLTGTEHAFSNGIHLGVIDAAADPAAEAWANIDAIDDLCTAIASAEQHTMAAISAGAGAGGVMAALCADITVARTGVVLNPYYDMGIFGSELHTLTVAGRVGPERAAALLGDKLPISAEEAARIGLITAVGPRDWSAFGNWLRAVAVGHNEPVARGRLAVAKERRRAEARPLSYYRTIELAEMARDLFDDRHGFAAKRHAFLRKSAPLATPDKLRFA